MSRGWIGILVLLVLSLLFGIIDGHAYFNLFVKVNPPQALSEFSKGAAYTAFVWYGVVQGALIFVFSLVAVLSARFFRAQGSRS